MGERFENPGKTYFDFGILVLAVLFYIEDHLRTLVVLKTSSVQPDPLVRPNQRLEVQAAITAAPAVGTRALRPVGKLLVEPGWLSGVRPPREEPV